MYAYGAATGEGERVGEFRGRGVSGIESEKKKERDIRAAEKRWEERENARPKRDHWEEVL